jgi:hypothetical protein
MPMFNGTLPVSVNLDAVVTHIRTEAATPIGDSPFVRPAERGVPRQNLLQLGLSFMKLALEDERVQQGFAALGNVLAGGSVPLPTDAGPPSAPPAPPEPASLREERLISWEDDA